MNRADLDVRVYLVTEPSADLDTIVAAALAGGATLVQLRDKTASPAERRSTAERLHVLTAAAGVPLVVNDDLEAARCADGVHVGVGDTDPVAARAALGPAAIVGWSINDLAQLDDAERVAACDYVAVSPVWSTDTKPDHTAPLGLEGVRAVADRVGGRLPVVAIGGIDVERAASVVEAGADGIAVVSAITRAVDPESATRALRTAVAR